MIARRLLRAVARPIKRLVRPLRIAHLKYLAKHSAHQIQRLREMRADIIEMEREQCLYQVELHMRCEQIERGLA